MFMSCTASAQSDSMVLEKKDWTKISIDRNKIRLEVDCVDGTWGWTTGVDPFGPPIYIRTSIFLNNEVATWDKRLVAYQMKDACSNPPGGGDNPGGGAGNKSGCQCYKEMHLEVNGTMYPTPFLGGTNTGGTTTYFTQIPVSGGLLLIAVNNNTIVFEIY